MTKLVIIHPGIYADPNNEALVSSLLEDVISIRYTDEITKDALLATIPDQTVLTHVAFLYHYPGFCTLPFFPDILPSVDSEESVEDQENTPVVNPPQPKYRYFSDNAIDILQTLSAAGPLTVDILTCDLKDAAYAAEVAQIEKDLGVNIRYSVDKTGNPADGGNWILESEERAVSVRETYFTEGVLAWTGVLTGDITAAVKAGTYSAYIAWNETTDTFTVQNNFTWTTATLNNTSFITMLEKEVFDGSGYSITLGTITGWLGFIVVDGSVSSLASAPLIKNLDISGGTFAPNDGGGIIRASQKFFKVDTCKRFGTVSGGRAGGIVGPFAANNGGSCLITNCENQALLSSTGGGGIVGANAADNGGFCQIINCKNFRNNSGTTGGGIVGTNAGTTNGLCDISGCSNTGSVTSSAGGIVGSNAGINNGKCQIFNCSNTGAVSGTSAGGIVGINAGSSGGLCDIYGCDNSGNITSTGAGGIVGGGAGSNDGNCVVTNCSSKGAVSGVNVGGIVGINAGTLNGSCKVIRCVRNGTFGTNFGIGGIVGANAGVGDPITSKSGLCEITECSNIGNIITNNGGGIVGNKAGADNGKCIITDCSSNGNITGANAGGIAGQSAGANGLCQITGCYSIGTIGNTTGGGNSAGGIVGADPASGSEPGLCVITKCYSEGDILGENAGGIAGSSNTSTIGYNNCQIRQCYSTGGIIGNFAGGIAGYGVSGTETSPYIIENCFSTGDIIGSDAGGIAGYNCGTGTGSPEDPPLKCMITNCYSTGNITETAFNAGGIVGGIAGAAYGICIISNCYSTGSIEGVASGGIAGSNVTLGGGFCSITNCYSLGDIIGGGEDNGQGAGGILGAGVVSQGGGLCIVSNCYSAGSILGINAGGIAGKADYIEEGTCEIRDCVSNGRQIAEPYAPEITLINPSTVLSDINGAIYTNWLPSVWLTGNPVTVTVDESQVDYRLPILKAFTVNPWNVDTYRKAIDPAQFGIANSFTTRVNPYLALGPVIVYTTEFVRALVSHSELPATGRAAWATPNTPAGTLFRDLGRTAVVVAPGKRGRELYRFVNIQLISGPASEGVPQNVGTANNWYTGWICTWSSEGYPPAFP